MGRGPRHEYVKIEFADELEALEVSGSVAGPEHGGGPVRKRGESADR